MKSADIGTIGVTRITWTTTIVIGLMIALLAVMYVLLPNWREGLVYFSALSVAAATLHTAYYASASVASQVRRSRLQTSFDTLRQLDSVGFLHVRSRLGTELRSSSLTPAQFHASITSDSKLLESVVKTLSIVEDAALGVQSGYLDESVLYYSVRTSVISLYEELAPFVSHERAKNPRLYVETEKLVHAWKRSKSLASGERYTADSYPNEA